MTLTKKFGRERAVVCFKQMNRKTNIEDMKDRSRKAHFDPKMKKDVRPYHEGFRDRMCELLKVNKEDYKLYWEK